MKPQGYQLPEVRDENDNIIQNGTFGKKSPFVNGDNTAILDYIINNLEALKGMLLGSYIWADSLSTMPTTGDSTKLYIAKDTGKQYRWNGTTYTELTTQINGLSAYEMAVQHNGYTGTQEQWLAEQVKAVTSADEAEAAKNAAAQSETNAANSATAASQSETNAGQSATAASGSATAAANSASAAAQSETNAANSATSAGNSATAANDSATAATNSASAAAQSESNATNSAKSVSDSVTQITTNKTNIETLTTQATQDETQIADNKTKIASLTDTVSTYGLSVVNGQLNITYTV